MTETTEVLGILRRIIWTDGANRLIGEVWAAGFERLTVLGEMFEPAVGQEYCFCGRLEPNLRYGGQQLKLETYRTVLPDDRRGIVHYLVATARWVGPSTADAIVAAYGDQALTVIKTDPERVAAEIDGITAQRAAEMAQSLRENERLEAAQIELANMLGGALGPSAVSKAIKRWGATAGRRVRRNPFILQRLPGIGFKTADLVWQKLGRRLDAYRRHGEALSAAAGDLIAREGHTVLTTINVMAAATGLLGMPLRPRALEFCRRAGLVQFLGLERETAPAPPALPADELSTRRIANAEQYVAAKLIELREFPRRPGLYPQIDPAGLSADQARAVAAAQAEPVFLLVGAPGTGKTYTVARLLRSLSAARVALAAPTGKAAKQLERALQAADLAMPVTTIHSLLEPMMSDNGEFSFGRDAANPIDADVVIIDETSMVDVHLARSLLAAVAPGSRLLLVGDHYQLPSIGPGAILRDLLAAGLPSAELTEIKRNAGRIVRACHAIKDGQVPAPVQPFSLGSGENWRHFDAGSPPAILGIIEQLLAHVLPRYGYDPTWDVQIITATNEVGALSCEALNNLARGVVNPTSEPIGRLPFRLGDKVVRLKNALVALHDIPAPDECDDVAEVGPGVQKGRGATRVVNGDLGTVLEATASDIIVRFGYPTRTCRLRRSEHELKPAYALTCHKMQGSETPVVILPLHHSLARIPLWTREWLYTALSRAKTALITVGDLGALTPGVLRQSTSWRRTRLPELLRRYAPAAEMV